MRIIITGDILRPDAIGGSHQEMNIRGFFNLFEWQISQAVRNLDLQMLHWTGNANQFNAREFYKLNGLDVNAQNWARIFNAEICDMSQSSIEYLKRFFPSDAIVIGFELPDFFIKLFEKIGVGYIDFAIHPVRFLDDIFFGIRTNQKSAFEVLTKNAVPEERFFIQANLHKTTMSKIPQLNIEENSCLFACQTKVDKSLISEGKVLGLADYLGKFEQISKEYRKIYFKLHPCEHIDETIIAELKRHKYAEFIDENIYRLICHENIKHVYSISSSVVYEASFFGKKATYFHKNPCEFYSRENAEFDSMKYVPVYDGYLNPAFWSKMLEGFCSVNSCGDISIPVKPNRMRISFCSYWGYNFLDFEQIYKSSDINLPLPVQAINTVMADLKGKIYGIPVFGPMLKFSYKILKKLKMYLGHKRTRN